MSFRLICVAVVAFLLAYTYQPPQKWKEAKTIRGWRKQLRLDSANSNIRVAVG